MMKSPINILPSDHFKIISDFNLQDFNYKNLILLYQPFIGSQSVAVYVTLVSNLMSLPFEQISPIVYENLLLNLNSSMHNFISTISRLEAVGLLKTFYDIRNQNNKFIYKLIPPLSAPIFFQNTLLSSMLIEYIGESKFNKLKEKLILKWPKDKYKEISHDFLDVFQKPKAKVDIKKIIYNDLPSLSSSLDVSLLKQLLKKTFLNLNDIEYHLKDIETISKLYGLDEIQIIHLLEKAADINNDKVNWQKLQFLVSEEYQFSFNIKNNDNIKSSDSFIKDNNKNSVDLSSKEKELIDVCGNYTPLEFLSVLKEEENTGESVTFDEKMILTRAISNDKLSSSLINFLIHYMLVDQGMSSINRTFFEKTINDWLRHHIKTPFAAMNYIRQRQKGVTIRHKKNNNNVFNEKLPSWIKEQQENNSNDLSDKESEEVANDIKRLMKKIEESTRKNDNS